MDRSPESGIPEEQALGEEARRKRERRLLRRLRGFKLAGPAEQPTEVDLTAGAEQDDGVEESMWSREEEQTGESIIPRIQLLGRSVLEQTRKVHYFAESLTTTVESLPTESRESVKPQADRLQTATGNLQEAAEELNDELESLDQTIDAPAEARETSEAEEEPAPAAAEVEDAQPEKPKRDHTDAMGMARLVIATLIGGGLGALVGEGKKDKKMAAKIEQQKAKMAKQEAELQQLKSAKPEAKPHKEYIEKAAELAERQTELAHSTVEQVRLATKQAEASETTFKIPERQPEEVTAEVKAEATPGAEKLRESLSETRDGRGHEQVVREVADVGIASSMQPADDQKQPVQQKWQPIVPQKLNSQTWIYWALLGFATLIALGLIIFSPK